MNWWLLGIRIVGAVCLFVVLLGAFRGVFDVSRLTTLRKFDETTRYPFIGLAVLGLALLLISFYPETRLRSVEAFGFKAELDRLDTKVETLSQQMEAFFRQRRTEFFDKSQHWDRVRVERTKNPQPGNMWDYKLSITLAEEPIPKSIDVWWGMLPVTDYVLDGRVVTLVLSGAPDLIPLDPELAIRVTYYPKTAAR